MALLVWGGEEGFEGGGRVASEQWDIVTGEGETNKTQGDRRGFVL